MGKSLNGKELGKGLSQEEGLVFIRKIRESFWQEADGLRKDAE